MGWDFDIGDESFNYTYNVSGMFYAAIPATGIRTIDNKTGKDSLEILLEIYNFMVCNNDDMLKLNPDNGWGDYYGALTLIHKLIQAALKNPDEVWQIS